MGVGASMLLLVMELGLGSTLDCQLNHGHISRVRSALASAVQNVLRRGAQAQGVQFGATGSQGFLVARLAALKRLLPASQAGQPDGIPGVLKVNHCLVYPAA